MMEKMFLRIFMVEKMFCDLLVVVGVAVQGRGLSAENILQFAVGQISPFWRRHNYQAVLGRVHPLHRSTKQ